MKRDKKKFETQDSNLRKKQKGCGKSFERKDGVVIMECGYKEKLCPKCKLNNQNG